MGILNSLLLAAAVTLPFPAPKSIPITDDLKCDWGAVRSINADGTELVVETQSGPVTLRVDPNAPVYDASGRPAESARQLSRGQDIRVYYRLLGNTVEEGGQIHELDLNQ